jgi:DNA-binding transcriptional MerR regulator
MSPPCPVNTSSTTADHARLGALDLRVGLKVYRRDMTATLRISQLAERSGFRPSALRYYEQVGLLEAAERTPGGYRMYEESAVPRLQFIDRAKQLGLPLEEIRELIAVWDGGQCVHVRDRLARRITAKSGEVRSRIRELTGFAAQLEAARGELAGPAPDGPCGPGCGCADGAGASSERTRTEVLTLMPRRPGPGPSADPAVKVSPAVETRLQTRVPVACTLDSADQLGRLDAWSELLAKVTGRERLDGGVRLTFPPSPVLAGRLGELAAREQACCAFFTFALRLDADGLRFDVTAPEDAAGVVADLFGGRSE